MMPGHRSSENQSYLSKVNDWIPNVPSPHKKSTSNIVAPFAAGTRGPAYQYAASSASFTSDNSGYLASNSSAASSECGSVTSRQSPRIVAKQAKVPVRPPLSGSHTANQAGPGPTPLRRSTTIEMFETQDAMDISESSDDTSSCASTIMPTATYTSSSMLKPLHGVDLLLEATRIEALRRPFKHLPSHIIPFAHTEKYVRRIRVIEFTPYADPLSVLVRHEQRKPYLDNPQEQPFQHVSKMGTKFLLDVESPNSGFGRKRDTIEQTVSQTTTTEDLLHIAAEFVTHCFGLDTRHWNEYCPGYDVKYSALRIIGLSFLQGQHGPSWVVDLAHTASS